MVIFLCTDVFSQFFSACGRCDSKSVSLVSVYQSQTSGFHRHLLVNQCPLLQRGIVIVQPNVHRFVKKKERQFCFFGCVFYILLPYLLENFYEIDLSLLCFQGQFSINLIGTGFKVAQATKWTSQGNYVSVKVHRSEVKTKRSKWTPIMLAFSVGHAGQISSNGSLFSFCWGGLSLMLDHSSCGVRL